MKQLNCFDISEPLCTHKEVGRQHNHGDSGWRHPGLQVVLEGHGDVACGQCVEGPLVSLVPMVVQVLQEHQEELSGGIRRTCEPNARIEAIIVVSADGEVCIANRLQHFAEGIRPQGHRVQVAVEYVDAQVRGQRRDGVFVQHRGHAHWNADEEKLLAFLQRCVVHGHEDCGPHPCNGPPGPRHGHQRRPRLAEDEAHAHRGPAAAVALHALAGRDCEGVQQGAKGIVPHARGRHQLLQARLKQDNRPTCCIEAQPRSPVHTAASAKGC
mmetsp:Transcript_128626/g.412075  ORF Transcript_128626/g.412075 Transcript_128626/m.412075 type:complete len:269 (+) Transcript_128626:741-1547(+)